MAMVFTLVTWLQGALTALIQQREDDERREEAEKAEREAEVRPTFLNAGHQHWS